MNSYTTEEQMNRRGFIGILGLGVAGLAAGPMLARIENNLTVADLVEFEKKMREQFVFKCQCKVVMKEKYFDRGKRTYYYVECPECGHIIHTGAANRDAFKKGHYDMISDKSCEYYNKSTVIVMEGRPR